jgi:hypothetical protein
VRLIIAKMIRKYLKIELSLTSVLSQRERKQDITRLLKPSTSGRGLG